MSLRYTDRSRNYYAGNGFIAYFVINEGNDPVIPPAKKGVGAMGHHM